MPDSIPAYKVFWDEPFWRNFIHFARINNVQYTYKGCCIIYISMLGVFFFKQEVFHFMLYFSLCHFTVVDQHPVVMIDFVTFH